MSNADMTIAEFCDLHKACHSGREWALKNCASMQDAWGKMKSEWLFWVATRPGVLSDKELRLFAVWSARQVQHLIRDQRSIAALDVAERFAHGAATREELGAARAAAGDAVMDAARSATWAATRDAALAAALAAAMHAARATAEDAAEWAGVGAAWAVTCAAQAEWLRKNTTPNFGVQPFVGLLRPRLPRGERRSNWAGLGRLPCQ